MIIDTSAIMAILNKEPEGADFQALIRQTDTPQMSAATYVELGAVIERRRDPVLSRQLDELIELLAIRIVDVDEDQAKVARAACRDFGKGLGSRAQLNFGDTFSYALASVNNESLLFKGEDFSETDIRAATQPPGA